jgi:hypothetical protein
MSTSDIPADLLSFRKILKILHPIFTDHIGEIQRIIGIYQLPRAQPVPKKEKIETKKRNCLINPITMM